MPLNNDQRYAFELAMTGVHLCITGIAGAGKSYLIKTIINEFRARNKKICVCAPTGLAAINIGGMTIHRAFGITPFAAFNEDSHAIIETLAIQNIDTLIIDEISMCRADLFDYVANTLNCLNNKRERMGKTPVQLIVVGDFFQLPPVITKNDKEMLASLYGDSIAGAYAFQAKHWNDFNFAYIDLTKSIRQQDADFVDALCQLRKNDISALSWINEHSAAEPIDGAVILCGRNKTVDEKNNIALAKLDTPSKTYRMGIMGSSKLISQIPAPEELILKPGCRVMALINNADGYFQNGSLGTVLETNKRSVKITFDNGIVCNVARHTFDIIKPVKRGTRFEMKTVASFSQIPLKLAYAVTIHKSQGQTFDSVHIYPECWDAGQLYTALSRVSSVENMSFATPPQPQDLKIAPEVMQFAAIHNIK